jgi:sterol desaturase/sphingolipid hydroxylase (fatty acid hydroxylase superfamily)
MKLSQIFSRSLIGLLALGILFFVIEKISGRSRNQRVFRSGYATDLLYFFTAPFVKIIVRGVIVVPAAVLIFFQLTTPQELRDSLYHGYGPLSRQPAWLQGIQIYVLVDFFGYWTHRLFHTGGWWPFHAVHHSSKEVDWLASVRVHPINDLVDRLFQATPVLLLGYNPTITLATAPILTLYAIMLHANVDWDYGPLRSVIASPVFHRWHHSDVLAARDKNFAGLLPLWDILFGTYYMPRNEVPLSFGIDSPMPTRFLAQLWEPFAALLRKKGSSS